MELLTADNGHADILLHEERYNLGDISIEELHRLVYAQVLSSHPLTWQVSSYHFVLNLSIIRPDLSKKILIIRSVCLTSAL